MFSSILVAAILALPFVSASLPADCSRTYTVVEGDICDSISAAHNVSTYQLAAVNSPTIDASCSNLAIGQEICLGTTNEDCANTYVIQPDDTCEHITNTIGVNTTILYANNPQINAECSNIYVGEVLCSLGEVRVPPAPATLPLPSNVPEAPAPGTVTAAPAPVQTQTPAGDNGDSGHSGDDDDDDNIPWCEDPNDDGEW